MKFERSKLIEIRYSINEDKAVKRAILSLRQDLQRVFESKIALNEISSDSAENDNKLMFEIQNGMSYMPQNATMPISATPLQIIVGTLGAISDATATSLLASLPNKKEAYIISVSGNQLYLLGADRRGTIYAIYDFCKRIGVSPWYFFADVPVKPRESFELPDGFKFVDFPTIEYRGIFINDEEELEKWAINYMGERTIGVKTYERIFELLLRLKLNYLWPAMHVNSFNANVENGRLADDMGIVIGTSHCDMLMRSNNREWTPWKLKKGYSDVEYDFSIEGENRKKLIEYWRESVEQNKDFDVTYTLGMRGIHDSGFNAKGLAGLTGDALVNAKIGLLSEVFNAQNNILDSILEKDVVKLFVPYKEVLELYDNGLEVPEDFTLIWTNDNYGYVRRYPDEAARARKGGHGIYYHQSYWAPPEASYLFINSCPLMQMRYELSKAYDNGIQKLWVTNFGAIKPLEQQLSYYAALAFDYGKENELTADPAAFLADWLGGSFTGNFTEFAKLLIQFDQVVNMRKIELMDNGVFYQNEDSDEAAGRIHFLRHIYEVANNIYSQLPKAEQPAFFEMIMLKIHAAYFTNAMYYHADKSQLLSALGQHSEADEHLKMSETFDLSLRKLLHYYNYELLAGKWAGIVTPEDFPPPRTALYPAGISTKCFENITGVKPSGSIWYMPPTGPVNRITIEADSYTNGFGVRTIPLLGHCVGNIVELSSTSSTLRYEFEISSPGEYMLTIERYPSLNSVGQVCATLSLDGIEHLLNTEANDEHRGCWKSNILNNFEPMTISLGCLSVGTHTIELTGAESYFAFTRIHIHDKPMDNHIWVTKGLNTCLDDTKPVDLIEIDRELTELYGRFELRKRPESVLIAEYTNNSVGNEDVYCLDLASDNSITIPASDALCADKNAGAIGATPCYCIGVGRSDISIYYPSDATMSSTEDNGAFYDFDCNSGSYIVYACIYTKGKNAHEFEVRLDGHTSLSKQASADMWKYSSENIYHWVPVANCNLSAGPHHIEFIFSKPGLRLEKLMIMPQ